MMLLEFGLNPPILLLRYDGQNALRKYQPLGDILKLGAKNLKVEERDDEKSLLKMCVGFSSK